MGRLGSIALCPSINPMVDVSARSAPGPTQVAIHRMLVVGVGELARDVGVLSWAVVATVSEAIARWQTHPVDLVLVDLASVGSEGLSFIEALAALEPLRPLPLVLWVATGQERLALQGMKLGAADYLLASEWGAELGSVGEPGAIPSGSSKISGIWSLAVLETHLRQVYQRVQHQRQVQQQRRLNLTQAHQAFQALVENSPDIIERFDLDLRHIYVSPALTTLTGIPAEAFLGKSCREMGLHEAMVANWEAAAQRLVETGDKQSIEFSTPTPMGVRHFEMVLAPEWDDRQRLQSILCISRDITDRTQTRQTQEQQLAAAEVARIEAIEAKALLTSVFDRINDGIIALDAEETIIYVNQRATQILNRAASDLLGKPLGEAFPEAVSQPFYADLQRAIASQQPIYQDHFYPPYERWVENRIYPSPDGTTLYFTDITDQKRAEADRIQAENLRFELSLLEETLESILAGYWDADFGKGTGYLSPGLKRMFGYADDELPNRPDTWQTLIFPEDLPPTLACLERHIASHGAEPYYNEVRYRHKDGSTVWVMCAGRVIAWDEAGQPLYMVGCHVDITKLKTTEAKLQRSEAYLREAQRIGGVGSWLFEIATGAVTWSDQVFATFGLEPGQPPQGFEALQALIHPDDRDRHRHIVETLVATHHPYSEEFRILRPDGSVGHIQVNGEVVLNDAGELTHLTGTTQDITQRKQAEAQLQALSLRLTQALASGQLGTWEMELATGRVDWDQRVYEIFGLQDLDRPVTYEDWHNTLHNEDRDRVDAALRATLEHDRPLNLVYRIWRTAGDLRWVKATALVVRDEEGQPLRIVGTNSDVTHVQRAEAQLRDLSLRLSVALESGGIAAWELDLTTGQATWDQRMYDIYGLPNPGQPITFADWRNSIHVDDIAKVDAALQRLIDQGDPCQTEFRIWRDDGQLRWIKSTALLLREAQGQASRIIGTNSDITEAKQAEEKLIHTTAQLEASNHELEAFAYSVSHDLRAPLRAIDGFSRALLEDYGDQFDADGKDYFDRIRHNVKRMGTLIDDLLRLSRVSRAAIVHQRVNLSHLVTAQLQELQANHPDRTVTATIAPNLTVWADPALMQVVVANLLENAWKFTSHHDSATFTFGRLLTNGEPVYYLRDDGAGFDMAYANKLFGVFQRLHNTDEFPGTGIGLATVQRVIHRHGGRIWAEGAIEQGATIYFTLPLLPPSLETLP